MDLAYRDQVLINEARTELKGSIVAWVGLVIGTAYLAFEFAGRAERLGFMLWLGAISFFLAGWFVSWLRFALRPPSDEAVLTGWIPGAKLGMTLCNAVTAASVWVFMPAAEPELRALLLVLYAWFLVVQFAAATEATQVLGRAVVMLLGSLTVWLMVEQPPHFLKLALLLPMFGLTLIAIRRFVREAVVKATQAQAAADASRRELAAALVSLERERDAKTQFIRAASHDLQQPLQAAALFLEQLAPGARAGARAMSLNGLRRSIGLARGLIEAMLQHLRLESGAVTPVASRFPAGELFDRVILTQAPAADAERISLRVVGRRVPLNADPLLLGRAVENLVANAIRHAGARRVLIGARAGAGGPTIWVIDDGRGLAPGEGARIFRPFEQGQHVGAAGGFGLGLASTLGLVTAMSGVCGVKSGLTSGAAFFIRLPADPVGDEAKCAA
ncbi:HAMP domain-containing sensor histidine kinase [Phenylobacterium sp.]|uniref:sensor histidine kinase n=1 Tax=Phenylobacterium sp. TaxID=1871053 RepID=UPI00286B4A1D|nr:HAMP domain-containing sensor histidine kinase [Phenylobacterium sp.]